MKLKIWFLLLLFFVSCDNSPIDGINKFHLNEKEILIIDSEWKEPCRVVPCPQRPYRIWNVRKLPNNEWFRIYDYDNKFKIGERITFDKYKEKTK